MKSLRTSRRGAAIVLSVCAVAGCNDVTKPADPTYDNPAGTHAALAVAIVGTGSGGVSVTPRAVAEGGLIPLPYRISLSCSSKVSEISAVRPGAMWEE